MQQEGFSSQSSPVHKSLSFATPAERHAFWQAAIQEQAASDLSVRAFCLAQSLPISSFHHWKQILRKRQVIANAPVPTSDVPAESPTTDESASAVLFAEVRLTAPVHSSIEIHHGSYLLRLQPDCDRTLLRDLLGMLGSQRSGKSPSHRTPVHRSPSYETAPATARSCKAQIQSCRWSGQWNKHNSSSLRW